MTDYVQPFLFDDMPEPVEPTEQQTRILNKPQYIITAVIRGNVKIFLWRTHDNGMEWVRWSAMGRKKPRRWNSYPSAARYLKRLDDTCIIEKWVEPDE